MRICAFAIIVAVALVAILSAAGAPSVLNNIAQGRVSRAQSDVQTIAGGIMRFRSEVARYPNSSGVLLDAHVEGMYGGTGVSFDWKGLPALLKPVVLAGGLNPDNVADAIRIVHPWGVDVSSGVESKPGKKDRAKVEAFVSAVNAADEEAR